jgi:hypothetical protein
MDRRIAIAIVTLISLCGSAFASDDQGFLLAPVDARTDTPRPAPIPSQDIRPVRAELPDDMPKPARMTGVRTANGVQGTSAKFDDYDKPNTISSSARGKPIVMIRETMTRERELARSTSRASRIAIVAASRTAFAISSMAAAVSFKATIASAT